MAKKSAPPPETLVFSAQGTDERRAIIAAEQDVNIKINGRLYALRAGQTAPMRNFEAQYLISNGAPVWIELPAS